MNFALILFILVVIAGIAWVADKLYFLPRRRQAATEAVTEFQRQQERVGERFADENAAQTSAKLHDDTLRQPWWLEYSAGFFPVLLLVFALRSFVVEPYKIPSGSMMPTLLVGDFILVNKFDYGIRSPISDQTLFANRHPKRGDVVVFRSPEDESIDLIKRVVGVPGDVVDYHDKQLKINGVPVPEIDLPDFLGEAVEGHYGYWKQYQETLDGRTHGILKIPSLPPYVVGVHNFPQRENCDYDSTGFTCKVPPGNYFMMGDNRDNSEDSRYWGFAPDKNLVGRAFFVWMNFSNLKRIGAFH